MRLPALFLKRPDCQSKITWNQVSLRSRHKLWQFFFGKILLTTDVVPKCCYETGFIFSSKKSELPKFILPIISSPHALQAYDGRFSRHRPAMRAELTVTDCIIVLNASRSLMHVTVTGISSLPRRACCWQPLIHRLEDTDFYICILT